MTLSQGALQAILASSTKKVFLECLKIEHSQITTRYLVNDTQDLVRSGTTYTRFPFEIQAMAQNAEKVPGIQIRASMVDQSLVNVVRTVVGLREKALITYDVVLSTSPDTIEYGPVTFVYAGANSDNLTQMSINALFLPGALNDAFPGDFFGPSNAG